MKRVLILSLVLLYKIVLCNVFKDRIASDLWGVVGLISVLRVQRYGLLAHTPNFWRRNFGEIFGNFSWNGRNSLNASALRRAKKIAQFCALGRRTWPFVPAGGQKCWFAGAQTGGKICSLCARWCTDVQMCWYANKQTPRDTGNVTIYTYTRARTRAHVLHFEAILCASCTNEAFLSDNQGI